MQKINIINIEDNINYEAIETVKLAALKNFATKYENGDISIPKMGKPTFKATNKGLSIPTSAKCPECGSLTYAIVCPSCHNKLPESTLLGRDDYFSSWFT